MQVVELVLWVVLLKDKLRIRSLQELKLDANGIVAAYQEMGWSLWHYQGDLQTC